jgi:hypothetical protein
MTIMKGGTRSGFSSSPSQKLRVVYIRGMTNNETATGIDCIS